jgi:hypothetical protein
LSWDPSKETRKKSIEEPRNKLNLH